MGDTAVQRGDVAEAGARMDCDDVGDEGGVPWATVPWAALKGKVAVPDTNVVDMGSHAALVTSDTPSPQKRRNTNKRRTTSDRTRAAKAKFPLLK